MGPELLSWLSIWVGAGHILGSAVYMKLSDSINPSVLMTALFFEVSVLYFSIVHSGYTGSVVYIRAVMAIMPFLMGILSGMFSISVGVMLLKGCEQSYLSRVSSTVNSLITAGIPVTSFLLSSAAVYFSVAQIFTAAGILSFFLTAVVCRTGKKVAD